MSDGKQTDNEKQSKDVVDVLDLIVVGGGVNGAGIAVDAAGRGLKVGLYEASDFGAATSSMSSKLIHGGLRYLEHYEFRLVSEALAEREVLLRKAPHIVKPMRFRLPHRPFLRPAWMIRIGLFLYDFLGKRTTLPASHSVDLSSSYLFNLFKPNITKGFEYSDCWVDDARLVLLNVVEAERQGAEVKNYCRVEKAEQQNGLWNVTLFDEKANCYIERQAKVLVNATGPWVNSFFDHCLHQNSPKNIRLIKGSHIIVPRLHDGEEAYILQNEDNRIVFVTPYLDDFSLIGTTDVEYQGDPKKVKISEEEIAYLIDVVNQHFVHQIKVDDIISTYSGVRPLCDDESDSPQAVTRDYTLELTEVEGKAPLLSVFGGKLTTYRKLAEAAMTMLNPSFPTLGAPWTKESVLPGGDFLYPCKQLINKVCRQYQWLNKDTARRYVNQYGDLVWKILTNCSCENEMGTVFAKGVYQAELDYLVEHEFVYTVEDILWRRTKLGLILSQDEKNRIAIYLEGKLAEKS